MAEAIYSREAVKHILASLLAVPGVGRKTVRKIQVRLDEAGLNWRTFWHKLNGQNRKRFALTERQWRAIRLWRGQHQPKTYFGSLQTQNISVIDQEDNNYPFLLKKIYDSPILLYVKGNKKCLNRPAVAVVGTRQISGYGRQVCAHLVPSLVASGLTVVSGFMYGVDVTAQKLANQSKGQTIGVLGSGFNQLYPRHHQGLMKQMLVQGQTFISEYPPDTAPQAGLFVERNRLIAGLSLVTVVVEAGRQSGSHITARLAAEYGRGVCAVAGPLTNPFSEGTKWLVNQGARLVTSAEEIIQEAGLGPNGWGRALFQELVDQNLRNQNSVIKLKNTQKSIEKSERYGLDQFQEQLLKLLKDSAQSADQLAATTGATIAKINSQLSLLELSGWVERHQQDWFVSAR